MGVFRRRRRVNGKVVKSRCWYGEYRDASGKLRRVGLCSDKRESERLLAEYVTRTTRERLGIVNRYAEHEKRPLCQHLEDYALTLEARNNTRDHVSRTVARIRRVLGGCGVTYICDLDASKVERYLADLRQGGLGMSVTNHYLRAVKSFAIWLVKDGRTNENRLAGLSSLNAKADLRHERRPLSEEEAQRLVAAAEHGSTIMGLSGPHRALCYRLALTTGLRRNEIRSLAWASFDLDSDEATVTVEAGYSKRRRRDVLPLRADVATALREWRQEHPQVGSVFPLPQKSAKMLRADLMATGIDYRDSSGRVVDFHALRHTFITDLVRGGVHVKVAQALARHSTVALTMDLYTHLEVLDHRSALEVLPAFERDAEAEGSRTSGVA